MPENDIFLIDSNNLICSIDSSEKTKHIKAKKLMKECWLGNKQYALSIQNLFEFFVYATSMAGKPI